MTEKIEEWIADLQSGRRHRAAAARKAARWYSVFPVLNSWRRTPCGDTKGRGYFSLVWSEILHQLEGGIVVRSCKCTTELLWHYGKCECTVHTRRQTLSVLV